MSKKSKILYVDDEPINLFLFEEIMGEEYHIITAESGEEALNILNEKDNIEFVISDMNMPMMTGVEFIEKAKTKFKDKKYFILTGYSINDEIQQALDSKLILEYWTKPADFEVIHTALQQYD